MKLEGRVALVTGGAIRVGKAIALALAEGGAHVGITYRTSEDEARATVAELEARSVRAFAVQCDQRVPEQVSAAVRAVEEALGPVDVLVNSAAIFNRTPFEEATLEDWDSHLEVNLRGPWLFVQAVAPGMRGRGEGVVINIVDTATDRPQPAYLPYTASKAALESLTRGLARALAPQVRVNGIAPGTVLWSSNHDAEQRLSLLRRLPLQRIGTPEDIARAAVFLVENDYITGSILAVDGGKGVV